MDVVYEWPGLILGIDWSLMTKPSSLTLFKLSLAVYCLWLLIGFNLLGMMREF